MSLRDQVNCTIASYIVIPEYAYLMRCGLFPRTWFIVAWIKSGFKNPVLVIISQKNIGVVQQLSAIHKQKAIRSLVALFMLWCWPDKEHSTKVCIAYSFDDARVVPHYKMKGHIGE